MSNPQRIPHRVANCPIAEATVEIRFADASFPAEAIAGVLLHQHRREFERFEALPVASVPAEIRKLRPELLTQAHYRLTGTDRTILVGPRMVAVTVSRPYIGWASYSELIFRVFRSVAEHGFFAGPNRLGVRYMNFFAGDVASKLSIRVAYQGSIQEFDDLTIRVSIPEGAFRTQVIVTNSATLASDSESTKGTLIDIDTATTDIPANFLTDPSGLVSQAHDVEKKTFFEIVRGDLLDSMKPEY